MINYTTEYNTLEMANSALYAIYSIVRGENQDGVYETIGERIEIDPPVVIENVNALTKEQVDLIVKSRSQYTQLEQKVGDSINARAIPVAIDPPWIQPPAPPPDPVVNPVPEYVTPLQIRMAINMLGLREAVEAYVATLDQTAKDSWEYATVIQRDNPILVNGAIAMGKTTEDLDNMFILASTLI